MLQPPGGTMTPLDRPRSIGEYIGTAPLRVGVMCTIGALRFMPFLAAMRRRFPGLRLAVAEGTPARLGALLDGGALDLAIWAQPDRVPERWRAATLFRERFVVALPPGHSLAMRRAVRLADMDGHDYVSRESCEMAPFIEGLLAEAGVAINVVFASEREEWVQTMIAAGAGIACMPEHSPLLPGLVLRPMAEPEVWREIALIAPAGRVLTPAAATFSEAITSYDWSL